MGRFLHKLAKIISNIIFWILICIIIVLVGYIVVIKVVEKQNKLYEVPINFYTILSQSMYPTIQAGDIIITYRPKDNIYEVDDIITFVSNDSITNGITITHRIVEVNYINGEYKYRTKGDANATPDSGIVSNNNVIGKYVFKIPKAGFIQQFMVSKTGWIVAIVLPSLGIIIYDIIKLVKKINLENLKRVEKTRENTQNLIDVIEDKETPKLVEEQIDNFYEDMGIVNSKEESLLKEDEEEIENLFDDVSTSQGLNKEETDEETEIL